MKIKTNKNQIKIIKISAFTLIEALVAIAIISILTIAIMPSISKKIEKKTENHVMEDIENLKLISQKEYDYEQLRLAACSFKKTLVDECGCGDPDIKEEIKKMAKEICGEKE